MNGETFDDYLDDQGNITIRGNRTLIDFVDKHSEANGDELAYRFADYSTQRDGEYHDLTWRQFGVRLRAVAARLQQVCRPGERVAILAPQGLDYVVALFAAVYAGNVAVPLFDPEEQGHGDRLRAVLADCEPTAVLTVGSAAAGVRKVFGDRPAAQRPRIIAVEAIPDSVGAAWKRPDIDTDSVAYLQYTSGSTRTPAGVEITHRSVGTNLLQMIDAIGITENARGVTWLPLFHDMGLLTVILPTIGGKFITIMSPSAFVRRPYRWIKELAAMSDGAEMYSAAPNFAFEHAAARGLPKAGEDVDLSNVIGLINGSEPVSVASMNRFTDAFAAYGLPKTAIKPCYGMAEATLFVSATRRDDPARVIHVDRAELNAGRMVPVGQDAESAVAQVSCGYVARSQWAVIADLATGAELPDGTVGEIWLHGENMGIGYWGRPVESAETFAARLSARQPDSRAEGTEPDAKWMRTGDFGAYYDGELFITGRVKDLVIVNGRNHYPQDLEHTAQTASSALRPGFVAAFSVAAADLPVPVGAGSGNGSTAGDGGVADDAGRGGTAGAGSAAGSGSAAGGSGEQLVIVAERGSGAAKLAPEPIAETVRAAISRTHGVAVRDLLLVPAGSIPRTSSGKIAHRACRAAYLDGTLRGGHQQQAFPDAGVG